MYDIRLSDTYPACGMNWPTTLKATYDYLRRDDVRKALHIDALHKPEAWVECNHRVSRALDAQSKNSSASVTLLPDILAHGVPVLLFVGERDLMCNHIGMRRLVDSLEWQGARGLGNATTHEWTIESQHVGTWKSARGLTLATIANASHMAGFDAPLATEDMLNRFLAVEPLAPLGARPKISSHIDGDSRVLVADALPSPTQAAPQAPPPNVSSLYGSARAASLTLSDGSGAVFVLVLIGIAVGACLYMRKRRRLRIGSGYKTLAEGENAERQGDDPMELEHFTIGEGGSDGGDAGDDTIHDRGASGDVASDEDEEPGKSPR